MDPVELVQKAFQKVRETKMAYTRFTFRMIPLHEVCFANTDSLWKVAEEIISRECVKFVDSKTSVNLLSF